MNHGNLPPYFSMTTLSYCCLLHTVTGAVFQIWPNKGCNIYFASSPSPNNWTLPRYIIRSHNASRHPILASLGLSSFHRQCTSSSLSVVLLSSVNYTALSRRCRPRASVTTQLRPCKPSLRYPIGCQLLIHLTSLSSPLGGCRIFVDITWHIMWRPWVGMPPKLREDIHRQPIHNCYIISNPDIRRHIQVFGA